MKPQKHVGAWLLCSALALAGCTGELTSPGSQLAGSSGTSQGTAGSMGAGGAGTVPVTGGHAPLVPVAPAMRRLTHRQYQNSVHDIFGSEIVLSKTLEADETNERFSSLGAAKVTTSPRGVEQYRDAALELAELVLAHKSSYPELASCSPASGADPCLASALRSLGGRLFRRPLTDAEVARYAGVANANGDQQLGLGLRYALAALLQSPSFLYTPETGEESGGVLRYTSYEMATRLAYFLWDSTPDTALLSAASTNGLVDDAGLSEQLTRMLSADRAKGLASRFFGEAWNVSRLTAQAKSVELFPEWTEQVVSTARGEFDAFLADLTAQRRADLRELFTGRSGTGLLTSTAVIAANSPTDRTSPTYRGVFVLERVLCIEPPPPPANVSTELPADPTLPLRQRLEQHRSDPACKACHGLFDPLGLTFEGFDAIGRPRTLDAGQPIDTSGTFEGTTFAGVPDLAKYLASDPRTERCFAHQLSDFATGHAETQGEQGVVNSLRDGLVAGGYRFDALVRSLAQAPSFRYLAKPD